jgi:hypothetical protein
MRAGTLALLVSVLAGSCTPGEPVDRSAARGSPSLEAATEGYGLVVVKRVRETGPFPTEGSVSTVTIRPAQGPVLRGLLSDLPRGNRLIRRVAAGPFAISQVERPCGGSCGALDPPSNRCEAQHQMPSNKMIVLTVAVSYEGCELRFSEDSPIRLPLRDPTCSRSRAWRTSSRSDRTAGSTIRSSSTGASGW